MKKALSAFFEKERIEYYGVISYSDCNITNLSIIERESITPKSVIMFLLPYYAGETVNLSRYSASLDYHIAIRDITSRLISLLSEHYPNSKAKGYGDHSPIDERGAALSLGLGILGENGLLLNEKYGSYVFVADVITDIDPAILGAVAPREVKTCEGCGICKASCPTGILSGEGCDCLSAITQRKGALLDKEAELMRKFNTVWGCDECQRHCPHNQNPVITPLDFFKQDRIERLTTELLDGMDNEEFKKRAFAWRGRNTVLRNLSLLGY